MHFGSVGIGPFEPAYFMRIATRNSSFIWKSTVEKHRAGAADFSVNLEKHGERRSLTVSTVYRYFLIQCEGGGRREQLTSKTLTSKISMFPVSFRQSPYDGTVFYTS